MYARFNKNKNRIYESLMAGITDSTISRIFFAWQKSRHFIFGIQKMCSPSITQKWYFKINLPQIGRSISAFLPSIGWITIRESKIDDKKKSPKVYTYTIFILRHWILGARNVSAKTTGRCWEGHRDHVIGTSARPLRERATSSSDKSRDTAWAACAAWTRLDPIRELHYSSASPTRKLSHR